MVGPSREALLATYRAPRPEEASALLERARAYRAGGDHAAAGLCEKDAAAVCRMAHSERARAWDRARAAARPLG